MTVPVPGQLTYTYTEDGVTTVFPYPVRFLDAQELEVIREVDGERTVLTYSTDYTVSGAGNPSGGSITRTAATDGGKIIITRKTKWRQDVDLEDSARNPAEAVEKQLDRFAIAGQDIAEELARAVKLPVGEDPSGLDELTADLRRVAKSADEIDTVAGSISDVETVAENAEAVALAADKMGAIEAAPQAAERAEAAATVSSGLASAFIIAENTFATKTTAEAWQPSTAPDYIRTAAYSNPSDGGGGLYTKVSSEPTHEGKLSVLLDDEVTRAWYELKEDTVNVKMFGAKGDGTANDYTAILNAMTFVTSRGGGRVYFPIGNYRVTQTIQVPHRVVLVGDGNNSRIVGDSITGPVVTIGTGDPVGALTIRNAGAVDIDIGGTADIGFQINNATNILLDGVSLSGTFQDGFYFRRTWGDTLQKLTTHGASISRYCFRMGTAFNGNDCSNWYTGNFCEANFYVNAGQAHGNNFRTLTAQSGRYGLFVASSGFGFWNFDTIYTENTVTPIRLGDSSSNGLARGVHIKNASLLGPFPEHPQFSERVAHIDLENAVSCSIEGPGFLSIVSTGVSVSITGDGSRANVFPVVGADGEIKSIGVWGTGSGYTTATVTITSSTGSGATATATIVDGGIDRITVTNGGSGYPQPGIPLAVRLGNAYACAIRTPFQQHSVINNLPFFPFLGRRSTEVSGNSTLIIENDYILTPGGPRGAARVTRLPSYSHNFLLEWLGSNGDRATRVIAPPIL